MSISFHKLFGAVGALSLLVAASSASAAPSLGYPSGRPYYAAGHQHAHAHAYRSYSVSSNAESWQSFSHEPIAAADANKGAAVKPAAPHATNQGAASEHVATAPQTTTRQSYSYEPAPQRRGSARHSNHRDAWHYQKTDPRRSN
jgi:hypothetical protein